jgi:hypothetical protein
MSSILPIELRSSTPPPTQINGYLSITSKGGTSLLDIRSVPERSEPFWGTKARAKEARGIAERSGLTVIAESRLGLAVVGPAAAYEKLTGGTIVTKEVLVFAEAATRRYVTHVDIVGKDQPTALGCGRPRQTAKGIEAVVLERPRAPQASVIWSNAAASTELLGGGVWPSPVPPNVPGFYLRVPQDVSLGLGAPGALKQGFRGAGIKVIMVDTGHYQHPFFTAHHYQVDQPITMVPGTKANDDPVGHGTGESANIFACAPEAELQPIRASNNAGNLVASIGGFMKAKELKPQILTNSWGGDLSFPPTSKTLSPQDAAWVLEIKDAVEQGIFVIFSAGNGQFSVEPQIPEVFAAGGVYMTSTMALQASNYASGYSSPFFKDRIVPDACGLVGLLPRAEYLMLPVQPGCELDVEMSRPDDQGNAGDGTSANDGWGLFSGTSAAAPQIAGVAALLLSAKPALTPAQLKEALNNTCIDVTTGRCNPRFNASAAHGQDLATGFGLVNAEGALKFVLANF